jgi:DNA modification methylase
MQIIDRDPRTLKPFEKNPKKHPGSQIEKLVRSIEEFGFTNPILTIEHNGGHLIVAGHARVVAAVEKGLATVPTIDLKISYEKAVAYNVADNKIAELAEWDDAILGALMTNDIPAELLEATGFDNREISAILDKMKGVEEVAEVNVDVVPRCKQGQVWRLGGHRLMCGDATNKQDVETLMNGTKADMIFTDPPYGIKAVESSGVLKGQFSPIIGDDKPFYPKHLLNLAQKIIIFGGNYFANELPISSCWFVWDKKAEDTERIDQSDCELIWTNLPKPARIYRCILRGWFREGESNKIKRVHPAQKPIKLLSDILKDTTNNLDLILDPYGGSGSTLIACEQLDRRCFMMEIESRYCEIIMQRWEKFTGQKAELIEDAG